MKNRIYFLDNLRTFLIFFVILLHVGLNYAKGMDTFWIIDDPDKKEFLSLINIYIDLFVMVIMFYISGYFIPRSLANKSSLEFIKSKFKRIMIPWLIAVLTLIPAYKYIYLLGRGLPQEAWYTYFHFFSREGSNLYLFSNNPTQSWLWFLPVLFILQMIYLILDRTGLLKIKISLTTASIITILLSITYGMIISLNELTGWTHTFMLDFQRERVMIYLTVFLLGSLTYKLGIFNSDKKNKKWYIIANVGLAVGLSAYTAFALNMFFNMITPGREYYFISAFADRLVYYTTSVMSMMSFLYIFVHVFRFNFNKANKLMQNLNKNSYAVYIIHTVVIGIVGLILMKVTNIAVLKYVFGTILTFIFANLMINTYRNIIKKQFTMKTLLSLILSLGLIGAAFASHSKSLKVSEQENTEVAVDAPSTPLHTAIVMGDLATVKAHIEAGTDINMTEPYGGATPLMTATTFAKTEIALYLIEAGADIDFKKTDGSTPLHVAAFFGHTQIVDALLKKGADKTIRDNNMAQPINIVQAPFEMLKPIYDQIGQSLAPMGLKLDYDYIKAERVKILELLK